MHKQIKIVIVGAGLAGLAAARELLANGFEVTIVEARNRWGGRIWIDHSLGMPLAKGATWIHGIDNNPLMQWVQKLSTPYFNFDYQKISFFDKNGQPITRTKVAHFDDYLNDAIQKAQQFSWQQKQDISLADALASVINSSQFSLLEQDLFSRKLRFFENYIGAEYELLSARHWDEEEYNAGAHIILKDGYESIISELAQGCMIQFDTQVNRIQERIDDIVIHTNKEKIYADAVIITVPLGVLKNQQLKFDPDLSSPKKAAIQRLGMGLLNIILLKFPNCFWTPENHAFFLPNATTFPVFFNLISLFEQPILVGYNGGKTARLLENETDEQVIMKVMQQWQAVFPNIMKPEKYFLTRWGQDPYSGGSYSYLPVGATGEDRDLLAAPESNRLFFAGEATHRHFPATTHGAYLSGLREAKRIQSIWTRGSSLKF